jgi:hypothetical protein
VTWTRPERVQARSVRRLPCSLLTNLALRELDKRDRQEVARAIRQRRAAKEPRQAEAVVVWAKSLSGPGCVWRRLFLIAYLAEIAVRASFAALDGRWRPVAVHLVVFNFFALLGAVGVEARRRAQAAEGPNLEVLSRARPPGGPREEAAR